MDAMIWRHEQPDGVLYLPSSSTHDDMTQSLEWFFGQPFDFSRAFAVTLDAVARQVPTLTDVVVDLPPGIWGFSDRVLDLVSLLYYQDDEPLPDDCATLRAGDIRWEANPFLVTTRDPNDFTPALEYIAMHQKHVPTLRPVVNRSRVSIEVMRDIVRKRLGPFVAVAGLDEKMVRVDHLEALANMFVDGDVDINKVKGQFFEALRLEKTT